MKKIFAALLSGFLFVLWLLVTIVLGGLAIVTVVPLFLLIAFPEIVFGWLIIGGLILYFGGLFGEYKPEWIRELGTSEGFEDSD